MVTTTAHHRGNKVAPKESPTIGKSIFTKRERMDHRIAEEELIRGGKFRDLLKFWKAKKASFLQRAA